MTYNILLVSFDDAVAPWPYKTVFGEPLRTPNIDRLCDVSTAFHAAYAQAPVCGPSRASMMTTLMPPELGILDNSVFAFDRITPSMVWSHQLRQNGYFCSSGGKVHHRYKPLRPRDHNVLYDDERKHFSDDMGLPREIRKRAKAFGGNRNGRGTQDGTDDGFYYDSQSADSAISFLTGYDGSRPFYREVGFFSPHVPHLTPARFKRMYDSKNLRRPPEWCGYLHDNTFVNETLPEDPHLQSEEWWQLCVRNYFSAYSHGDYHLGRVLDALHNSRHAKNTLVVVVADHGFHLGNRNLFRKMTMWEQSLRVPFIVYDPLDRVRQEIHDPIELIDLGPTILDYAGVTPNMRRHGRSLRPILGGARDPHRSAISFLRENTSMFKDGMRIIRYGDGSYQLFDVERDFWNLNDLGTDHPRFAEMSAELARRTEDCGPPEEKPFPPE